LDERERLVAQRNEIAVLAGGLAHEIRNPLSTIRMNLELLAEELHAVDEPGRKRMLLKVERIQNETRHLEEVLDAFLQFARAGELELADEDLSDLVDGFIRFYQPEAERLGIEISPHLSPDLPPVCVDRALVRQVLMNLALNAQQAMPEGGTLELQTYVSGGNVCLDVIDTGCGMDEAARRRMFQAFFSTKSTGSGLGLPTVRKIMDAHSGRITCESEPGRGSRFSLCFPRTVATGDPVDSAEASRG
jgi:signal transduction histidine kinase